MALHERRFELLAGQRTRRARVDAAGDGGAFVAVSIGGDDRVAHHLLRDWARAQLTKPLMPLPNRQHLR